MLEKRSWVPAHCETRVTAIANATAQQTSAQTAARLNALVDENQDIHERAVDEAHGGTDGQRLFAGLMNAFAKA